MMAFSDVIVMGLAAGTLLSPFALSADDLSVRALDALTASYEGWRTGSVPADRVKAKAAVCLLIAGKLPDKDGRTCEPAMREAVRRILRPVGNFDVEEEVRTDDMREKLAAFAATPSAEAEALFAELQREGAGTVRIASFRRDITPALGAEICGYAAGQRSVELHDPLFACGLCIDDGAGRILIVALDLLGLDGFVVRDWRAKLAKELGVAPSSVLLTCTHTHSGPESCRRLNLPKSVNQAYLDKLEGILVDSVRSLASATWTECTVSANSVFPDENVNRRFESSENVVSYLTHRHEMMPLCRGIADKELGLLLFYATKREIHPDGPAYVIGNYAAHPLASHAPGIGGLRLSADFPGFFRDYLRRETGAEAMFIQGAGGDLLPKEAELGMDAARKTGVSLAKAAITAMIDARRNPARFLIADPRVGSTIRTYAGTIRSEFRGRIQEEYNRSDRMTVEVQCVSVGDYAFAGMPGELTNELGLEIKWHSPFRRTWIANLSTAYCGYLSPANFLVQGGYEPRKQPFLSRGSLDFVATAVDALTDLRKAVFPVDDCHDDPYPDCLARPLVNVPGGVKHIKFNLR